MHILMMIGELMRCGGRAGGACRGRFSVGWAVVRGCGFVWVDEKIQRKYRCVSFD